MTMSRGGTCATGAGVPGVAVAVALAGEVAGEVAGACGFGLLGAGCDGVGGGSSITGGDGGKKRFITSE